MVSNNFLSIEVWDSFATNHACKNILVSVHQRIDTSLTKLCDKFVDSCQVLLIVDSSLTLNALPHYTETDKVHSPLLKVRNIVVV